MKFGDLYISEMLTNEGQRPIMERMPDGENRRIALVDCQARYKRGEGWKAECAERDAIAAAIVKALSASGDA